MSFDIHIIGGGLAGSEAAWQLAEAGFRVRLSEMRGGGDMTPAHETDRLAEMVCSNSFRSDDAENNAVGLLHQEMRALDSLIMRAPTSIAFPPARRWRSTAKPSPPKSRARSKPSQHHVVRERVDACPTIRRSSPPAR
jgi:methylenetetrahydrofolate--tRNA-(uracil-5-)-methyltransferase